MILNKRNIILLSGLLGFCYYTSAQEIDTIPPKISEGSKLNAIALHYDAVRDRNKGDNAEAEQKLRNAIKFDPEGAGLYYDLARINMSRKQMGEAEKNLKKAIKLEPGNKWYKEQYAILLLDENKFKQAAETYEEILAEDEHNREYLQTIAYLYQRAGDKDKAIATFDKLLKMYGDDEELLEGKLQLYLNSNDLDKAVEVNNLLISIAPNESSYYVRLAEMYNNSDQPDKAADIYKKAEELFPDDPSIQLSLSEYYKKKGDKAKYKKYVEKVVTNNALEPSEQLTVLGGYIITAEDSTDREFGLQLAKTVAEQNPEDARAIAAYGDMLGIMEQWDASAEQYKRSAELEPASYVVWKTLLSVYLQEQKPDSIVKYSERALRLFPNQAQLHYLNGVAYNMKKDYIKAVNSLERAIDMMPEENKGELAGMYATLADIYNNSKDYEQSDENFEKSLKLSPDNPTTLNNYSYYLSERNVRLADAEKMSKRSLELVPDLPTFLDTYGWILYKQGNYKKAKEYVEKAIEKEDEAASATLWEHLGDIYYKLNDHNKALECWQKAKKLGTDSPHIDKKISEKRLYE
ncbi:MAG: tetratricopeptide repeat protein [Chitinophagaceae bacterium]|nr:tetratricopeptide repeat protein [Chitinophagaceae bacterium]MCB9047539.1 tetratricopeptide repeat protein [Chitinophagales bacterium]